MCYLIYSNGQRQGVVINMTVGSIRQAEVVHWGQESYYRIRVWQHKTTAKFGSASVVVPFSTFTLLKRYIELQRGDFEDDEPAFTTTTGAKVPKVSEDLKHLGEYFGETFEINPTLNRKILSTKASVNFSDNKVRAVATHMTHDVETAKRFYHVHVRSGVKSPFCPLTSPNYIRCTCFTWVNMSIVVFTRFKYDIHMVYVIQVLSNTNFHDNIV